MAVLKNVEKSFNRSIWLLYILIVFEILYMISPFALYYYSGYAIPLNLLQQSPLTSWLTVYIFPHFTYNSSWLINALLTISWPLIITGLLLFLVGFIQIYWAKFTKKDVVSKGLYKIIRHPQYVGLAILGLGATLYWSRFIVYIAYASMLFLYYFLAKQEERICLVKYGTSYQDYLDSTGMFFPKFLEDKMPKFPKIIPKTRITRVFIKILLFIVYLALIISIGFGIKVYTLTKISSVIDDKRVVIATAPLKDVQINHIVSLVMSDNRVTSMISDLKKEKHLIYVVPSGWNVPELDVRGEGNINMILNTSTHGNSLDFNRDLYSVLITEPVMFDSNAMGENILKTGISYIPLISANVDLEKNEVLTVERKSNRGKWDGIPVPIY